MFPYYEPQGANPPLKRCNGERVGGYCWYLGALHQSCDEFCARHDGYHDATRFFAGSGGSNSQCTEFLNALGAPGESWGIGEDTLFATGVLMLIIRTELPNLPECGYDIHAPQQPQLKMSLSKEPARAQQ